MLSGTVPASPQYWAAEAGDSPFAPGELLEPGTVLPRPVPAWFHPVVPAEPRIPFDYEVLFADRDLVVVDKPHFLPTTSNGRIVRETLQTRLRVDFREDDIVPLHRLDRLTAGVVVCSRNPATRGAYQRLFAERRIDKTYRARVEPACSYRGIVKLGMRKAGRQVVVDSAGTPTVTDVDGRGDEVILRPRTGHTHQLRVVMNHLGSPIRGDDTYPVDTGLHLYDFSEPLELLAESITFEDPFTYTARGFSSLRTLGGSVG